MKIKRNRRDDVIRKEKKIRRVPMLFVLSALLYLFLTPMRAYGLDSWEGNRQIFKDMLSINTKLKENVPESQNDNANFYGNGPGEQLNARMDEYGEITFHKNGMLKIGVIGNGRWTDAEGRLMNVSQLYDKWEATAVAYDAGTPIYLTKTEVAEFNAYYAHAHSTWTQENKMRGYEQTDKTFKFTSPNPQPTKNEEMRQKIIETYGIPTGGTQEDILYTVLSEVRKTLIYDESYLLADMETCLSDNKGVCWHYGKIAKTLLEAAGIHCEVVTGILYGGNHLWIRSKINGKWVYSDPTNFFYGNVGAGCLDYNTYLLQYVPYTTLPSVKIVYNQE